MPLPEGEKGDARIDAAVDHFVAMGFAARDVRSAVEALLKEHGGADAGWPFLEEGSYRAVQEMLLEKEEEEVALILDAAGGSQQPEVAVANEASPEHGMQISQVYSELPSETNSVLEKSKLLASPNESPVHEALLPFPTATSTARLRPPTYGWISTESESESESDDGEILSAVPDPAESLLCKRKRPSRWDECTKW
ncbi:unnamed protein product [Urochloa decumbens]|uniref:WIYLD domain-containing protein n=1 Tax=Urochloa decumbens TaxID=240449 RepID=A0ABC9FRL9_9POAL